MARARQKKVEEISLRVICERHDYDTSIFLNSSYPKHDRHPFSHLLEVRLQGKIIGPPKFKWNQGVIVIWPADYTPSSVKQLSDFGYVETKGSVLRARVVWPAESFSNIVSAVAAQRILEARLTISPVKYRSAAVLGLSLDTRSNEEFEREFLFWNGPSD